MTLRRYERPHEASEATTDIAPDCLVPYEKAGNILASSSLSAGSLKLLIGLLRNGTTRLFPGGGVGIEYGSLLKTAVRPDDLGEHVSEVAAHLEQRNVDLLLVPGMSGYPVGAMYALAAGIPAVLLKKQKLAPDSVYPAGSFAIPSYTGDGDVVMSADLDAVRDIVAGIAARQIDSQRNMPEITIAIRCAGADDIIDKAVMAHAITESAPLFCREAMESAVARHRAASGDTRPIACSVEVVSWVTPLIKSYNGPREHLERTFGIQPFAGVSVTSVHLDPPAIGVEGAGVFAFAE
jgi:hypothetical protein